MGVYDIEVGVVGREVSLLIVPYVSLLRGDFRMGSECEPGW